MGSEGIEKPRRWSLLLALVRAVTSGNLDILEASARVEKNEFVIRIRIKEDER